MALTMLDDDGTLNLSGIVNNELLDLVLIGREDPTIRVNLPSLLENAGHEEFHYLFDIKSTGTGSGTGMGAGAAAFGRKVGGKLLKVEEKVQRFGQKVEKVGLGI